MYHGGTSFGFMNGAIGDWGKRFAPMVTSYDYDAPIGEYGQLRPLYFAIKKVIQKVCFCFALFEKKKLVV